MMQVWLSKGRRLTPAAILGFGPLGMDIQVTGSVHPRLLSDIAFVVSGRCCAATENAITMNGPDIYHIGFGRLSSAMRRFLMDVARLRVELRVEFLRTVLHRHIFVGGDAPDVTCEL